MHSFILSVQVCNVFKYSDLGNESRTAVIDALRASTSLENFVGHLKNFYFYYAIINGGLCIMYNVQCIISHR